MKHERGIFELYEDDPERADAILWNRRGFLKAAGAAAMGAVVGASIPFARHLPPGFFPVALAESAAGSIIVDKSRLRVLNDRPLNAETPPHLLDDEITPNDLHYVRNAGLPPEPTAAYFDSWRLRIDGEVEREIELSLADLRAMPQVERAMVVECAGNGRTGFTPATSGLQWTIGGVGCAMYKGVRVRDVLRRAGVKRSAVYTGYYGADTHLSGDPGKVPISRGTPIGKAMHPDTLFVYEMNGAPLPLVHGAPLRMLCPGWPGSTSGKWLHRLWIRDKVHDGPKMTGMSYRVPSRPVYPGSYVDERDMRIIERMPVKSVITRPKSGSRVAPGKIIEVRGHAWSGERSIRRVDISTDFGATWISCRVSSAPNAHAWQRWTARLAFPQPGYFEIWARATDSEGEMQPQVVPGWNPRGYLNNAMHRVSALVG